MKDLLDKVFASFCDNLHRRKELMTEDNVRYYWFASMLEQDKSVAHYTMEYPYNSSIFKNSQRTTKKELDFLYLNGDESYCMEIKFHRNPDPDSTYAHTDAAGSLFNDLLRLSLFEPGVAFEKQKTVCELPASTRRLFLYVTDGEMSDYLGRDNNSGANSEYRKALNEFYMMPVGPAYRKLNFNEVPDTFRKSALDAFGEKQHNLASFPNIRLLYKDTYSKMESISFKDGQCHVRLYEIEPNPSHNKKL